jgi:hypothetical protein
MPGPSETSRILNYSSANSVTILDADVQINAGGRDLIRGKMSRDQRCPMTLSVSDGVRNLPCGSSYNDAK